MGPAATVGGSAIASIDATVMGIALPAIGRDLGAGLATLQWVVTAYTMTLTGLQSVAVVIIARRHIPESRDPGAAG